MIGLVAPPVAQARVGLLPGTELNIGSGQCSLGFLATNSAGTRLAVTAGHCADDVDVKVYSHDGTLIGTVCHHTPDRMADGLFGVTLICLSDRTYTADAYFTKFGNPAVGDYVKKYGIRTDKTEGEITKIHTDSDNPRNSRMEATLVGLPGDSGSAWVGNSGGAGPKLLGLNIGHTTRSDGGYGFAIGFPIHSLVALVKKNSPRWGQGFIPVGP